MGTIFPSVDRHWACYLFWDGNRKSFPLECSLSCIIQGSTIPTIKRAFLEDRLWTKRYFGGVSNVWRCLWDTKEYETWSLPARNLYSGSEDFGGISGGKMRLVPMSSVLKIQTLTLRFPLVNNAQLCIIMLYWILTIVRVQLCRRDTVWEKIWYGVCCLKQL